MFALTPFNFTAIAGNLTSCVALMGNVVVWKPSNTQIYSANVIMQIFKEAGLPDGVINLIFVDGPTAGDVIFPHREFAGIHFTGSTGVFNRIWQTIGSEPGQVPQLPAHCRRNRGQRFYRGAPFIQAERAGSGHFPWRV